MCEALVWSYEAFVRIAWLEVLKALAAIATAFIAWKALQNWKRQEKAKRKADYLDQLTEAVHSFFAVIMGPVTLVPIVKIGMESALPTQPMNSDPEVASAIEFIRTRGPEVYKNLAEALDTVRPTTVRLKSLAAKGQVLGFTGFEKCHEAIAILTQQFVKMQGLATMIHSPNMAWTNDYVVSVLKNTMKIDAEEIEKQLNEGNLAVHAFLREAYQDTFK